MEANSLRENVPWPLDHQGVRWTLDEGGSPLIFFSVVDGQSWTNKSWSGLKIDVMQRITLTLRLDNGKWRTGMELPRISLSKRPPWFGRRRHGLSCGIGEIQPMGWNRAGDVAGFTLRPCKQVGAALHATTLQHPAGNSKLAQCECGVYEWMVWVWCVWVCVFVCTL